MTTGGLDGDGPAVDDAARRRPRAVYGLGDEPDPRFSMANERTALAWVRTSLALVAGGVGLTSVARLADLPRLVDVAAAGMCVLGGWLAVSAVLGWRRKEVALRTGRPLPAPVALPWLAGGVVVFAAALGVLVLVRV
ncbi:MAG: YidH family protein [Kineosporiaceae bacterium]|jgi:putative membrane protein